MLSLLLLLSGLAQAAQTLAGTGIEITYNSQGTWNDSSTAHGLRASFDGGSNWTDFTYAGYPWQRFAVEYTQDGAAALFYNVSYNAYTNLTVLSEDDLSTATEAWSSYTYEGGDLSITKDEIWALSDQVVLVRFLLHNGGTADMEGLRLNFAVDPDQDSPTSYTTKNNVQSLGGAADVNWVESVGSTTGYSIGFGACEADAVALGHYGSWSSNVDADITLSDEGAASNDYEMNLRYTLADPLAPGQTTMLSLLVVVGETEAEAEASYLANVGLCQTCDDDHDGADSATCEGDDCDDTNDAIYPGATEVWYDGIDSDCDGGNDYDADRDGFEAADQGGSDCDDQDGTAFPGADDDWYDGVDSDCAGNDDFDQDGDGFAAMDQGGEDCDDTDPTVNPDATEGWYDGIDQNCDGNDDDRDGDGTPVADDCNDNDPTRAADCSGSDGSDGSADGSGNADGAADDTGQLLAGNGSLGGKGGCATAPVAAQSLLALGALLTLSRRRARS